jgi:predicted nucleic acid-binding Zn finger protein
MPERIKVVCDFCGDYFFHDEYDEKSKDDICSCDNIRITMIKNENSRYQHYIGVEYSRERPKIEIIQTA